MPRVYRDSKKIIDEASHNARSRDDRDVMVPRRCCSQSIEESGVARKTASERIPEVHDCAAGFVAAANQQLKR
jgi:hypothetical protein